MRLTKKEFIKFTIRQIISFLLVSAFAITFIYFMVKISLI